MHAPFAEETVLEDLLERCRSLFGLDVRQAEPIRRGWLHLKWKLDTSSGPFLLKMYNPERLRKHNHTDLLQALSLQNRLQTAGLPCPELLTAEGDTIHTSSGGEKFIVMSFCEGSLVTPGQGSSAQLYDLGRVTGRMHRLLDVYAPSAAGAESAPQFIPPSREERLAYWSDLLRQAQQSGSAESIPFIVRQIETSRMIDLEPLSACERGYAHRDLWADNLLFGADRVGAVLDFDRMKSDYPELDISRALMSLALDENGLDPDRAAAFLEGYRTERHYPRGALVRSLRMSGWMESVWWIRGGPPPDDGPSARFAAEVDWLAVHDRELSDRFGHL